MSYYVRHILSLQGALDYATNTQSLYKRHLEIARGLDRSRAWDAHIVTTLLPTYARELCEPTVCMPAEDVGKLASMLDYYYTTQIAERA